MSITLRRSQKTDLSTSFFQADTEKVEPMSRTTVFDTSSPYEV